MDINIIENFIRKQNVAFICSVDEEGFPNVKAMLKPRKIDGMQRFYFSSMKKGLVGIVLYTSEYAPAAKFYEKNGFKLSNGTICMYYE